MSTHETHEPQNHDHAIEAAEHEVAEAQRELTKAEHDLERAQHDLEKALEHRNGTYTINIEGTDFDWPEATITVDQIRTLAGWAATDEVIEVDLKTNIEKPLAENAIVHLKHGAAFARNIRFKRGQQ